MRAPLTLRAVMGDAKHQHATLLLECIECGGRSDEGSGWKAFLDEDTCDVWIYCAACVQREFEAF